MSERMKMLPTSEIPGSIDCLVDPVTIRNVAQLYQGKSEPSLSQILALFSFAEAVVLFERVILNEEWREADGFATANLSFAEPVGEALALADDLVSFSVDFGIPNDAVFDQAYGFCAALQERFGMNWKQMGASPLTPNGGFTLDITDTLNLLHRVWRWKTQHVVNPLWEMFFLLEPQSAKTTPKSIYDELATDLEREIRKLQQEGHPSVMYIPPIPAIALADSKGDLNGFWKSLADLRSQFASFRRKHAQYQKVLANPEGRSLGNLIQVRRDAIADVEEELKSVARKRADGRKILEFWDAVAKVEIAGHEGELEFGAGCNLKGLVSFGLRGLRALTVRGRARSIFRLRKKFLNIEGYESLLTKAFGIDESRLRQQIAAFHEYDAVARQAIEEAAEAKWTES